MTYNDFITEIWLAVDNCPKSWRKGQKVFNVIEELYGNVARDVQFIDGVDCFYDDSDETIELFINKEVNHFFTVIIETINTINELNLPGNITI